MRCLLILGLVAGVACLIGEAVLIGTEVADKVKSAINDKETTEHTKEVVVNT